MNSIRRRLSRNLLLITLLLLSGGMTALYLAARDSAIEQFDFTLRAKAMALSTMTVPTPQGVKVEFSDHFFPGFEDRRPRDFFEVWDATDRPLARSESLGRVADLPHNFGTLEHPRYWNLTLPTHHSGRAIGFSFQPKTRDNAEVGKWPNIMLVVASDRRELDETLWDLLSIVAVCATLLVAATLWLVPRELRNGLRPLDELASSASRIDATSLSSRFAVETLPLELRPIATRLNDLLARLESSFERERRFSADLAHELRTPLAELRSTAECALKWPESRDAATDRDVLAIARQMERLVGFILALSRAEGGEVAPHWSTISVAELVREVWRPFSATANARSQNVSLALSPTWAEGDEALLRSVLSNLFDNAVDHGPVGSVLEIELSESDACVVLKVSNDAPDLGPDDMPYVFDRLWRKEAARTGGKHVGLGLSIARSFADAMGWALTVSHDGRRITFYLSSPPRGKGAKTSGVDAKQS